MTAARETLMIAFVVAAACSDLCYRQIPNWLTVSGAALGFSLQVWESGLVGAWRSMGGVVLGLLMFMVFYVAGGMGAGDVKLFAAVGAFASPWEVVIMFVLTGLLGGIAAIALAAMRGRLRQTLERTGELMFYFGRLRLHEMQSVSTAVEPDALRLPYGAVIAGGAVLSLIIFR